jgi:hypothetical protein
MIIKMKTIFYPVLISGLCLTAGYSQIKTFAWSDSVDGEWNNGFDGKVRTSIDTKIVIIGNYLYKCKSDFTYHWKCIPEEKLFEYRNNSFQPIAKPEVFADAGKAFLDIANIKLKQNYTMMGGDINECLYGMQEFQGWERIGVEFNEKGISPTYYDEAETSCGGYNFCDTLITWATAKTMFKNLNAITPNFCTPSGPKVNVRASPGAKGEIIYQLDKGQFFEILETGKTDKVNGKPGTWYKINFEGAIGYIFSFYTLCK